MELQPRRSTPRDLSPFEPSEVEDIPRYQRRFVPYSQEQNALEHYWRIFVKRKWAVLATVVIIFALSALHTFKATKLYQASSKVAIFPPETNVLGLRDQSGTPIDYDLDAALETQATILRSDALAMKVIEDMHLDQDSRFTGVPATSTPGGPENAKMVPDPAKAAALIGAFDAGLNVQLVPRSRVLEITYTHSNPKLATEIVNELVKTFIEENFKTRYESVTQTSDWLAKELADLQLKVETSQEKLVRYQRDHSILGIDDKQNIVTAKLDALNQELTQSQSDRIQKESNYEFATSGDRALFEKVSPEASGALLPKLREKEAELSAQYAQQTTQFGSGYPKVSEVANQLKQVRSDIAAEQERVRQRLRNEYLAAVQREKLLTDAFNAQKREANQLNENAIEYSVLKRDADSNRQLYDDLLQRLKEAGVSAGLRSSNIRVVDIARPPNFPISPNVPQNIVLGLLFGVAGGIGLAFLLESLDRTVRNLEELSVISPLPALGTIPLYDTSAKISRRGLKSLGNGNGSAEAASASPVASARPKSEAAEAYRSLRTSILLSSFAGPPQVILVTSALPQEGKTTFSANIATVMAQRGSRVLLVDADLRRPGILRSFGLATSSGGLSTAISGVDKAEDVILPTEIPNLFILPAGPIPPQPAELLSSNAMREQIACWRAEFDHIVIDTPPCLSVTDAVVLSPNVDRLILVVRSGQTAKAALRQACDLLLQVNAKVMGIVLNALNLRSADAYYHAYQRTYSDYYEEGPAETASASTTKAS